MGKKALCLIFAFLFSINSFAAVVSDNDGSAFITKAEFDSLKNSFQSQIDNYNSSIDSKIDLAIASYLAGIKTEVKSTRNILVSNWGDVVGMNGVRLNRYDYPDVSGMFIMCERIIEYGTTPANLMNYSTRPANDWWKMIWATGNFSYADSSTRNTRNLVSGVGIGSTLDTSKMVWAGVGKNVRETWTLSCTKTYTNNPSGMVTSPTSDNIVQYCEYLNLIRSGYISNYNDASNPVWKPSVRWRRQGATIWDSFGYGTTYGISVSPSLEYAKDTDGKVKSYEHIINYKSSTAWTLCAENVTNYIGFVDSTVDTRRTNTWATLTTNTGTWNGSEYAFVNSTSTDRPYGIKLNALAIDRTISWADNTSAGATNQKQIPVMGLIGNYSASSIYQFGENDLKDEKGNKITQRRLHEGLPIIKVSKEDKIEWEPYFKDIYVDGVLGVNECRVILAYTPFTNMGNVSSTDDYVKMDDITKGEWAETSSKKVKIKFKADRDGYIYAKWVPKTDWTTVNGDTYWEATLDIPNCNTYILTKN